MTVRRASRRMLAVLVGGIVAAGCVPAGAQPNSQPPAQQPGGPPNALQGFSQNRDQPVTIKALSLDVHDNSKVATFTGNVNVVQGDTTMRCKTLVVYYDGDKTGGPKVQANVLGPSSNNQQIRRMEAKGDVLVIQKDQTATGDNAIYDTKENTVTLYAPPGGSVAVTQGPNIMRGASLVVHLDTGVSHLQGGAHGVEGLIIPNSTKKGAPSNAQATPASRAAPKGPGSPKGLY